MDVTIIVIAVIHLLTQILHLLQTKQWARERQDLYDRIMSRDIVEYKEQTQSKPTLQPVSNDDHDLYEKEIVANKV